MERFRILIIVVIGSTENLGVCTSRFWNTDDPYYSCLHVYEFAYFLKYICDRWWICGDWQKKLDWSKGTPAQLRSNKAFLLSSHFSSHPVNRDPLHSLFSATLFALWVFFCWRFRCFKWLCDISKYKMALMCLPGKMHVLRSALFSTNCRAIGCELNLNESMVYVK